MKSIYSKLLLIYVIITLIGFVTLTFGLKIFIQEYIYDQNIEKMNSFGENFQRIIDEQSAMSIVDSDFLVEQLSLLDSYSNSSVWLVSSERELYFNVKKKEMELLDSEMNIEEIQKVFDGEKIVRKSHYEALDDKQYYTLIYPIRLQDGTTFALYLNTELSGLTESIEDINKLAFNSLAISTMLASILIFMITSNITREIKKLNSAIKYISKGNYEYKLNTTRNDEFGELARGFNSMAEELKNIEGTRRKFVSDLSHDLRSPLTSIKGYTKGILDGTIPPEKWEKYLNIVFDETERLTKLTNDILDLSKMQSGDFGLEKADFDIHELLINILDTFEERIEKKGVEVNLKLIDEKTLVHGDRSKIERVVFNLIDNALKFVNEDGLLEVMTNKKEDKVLIGIRNTGSNIPKDKLSTIWNRFSKLDNSRGEKKDSSGLGLAIVKEILDSHEEKIEVYSNDYLGVMFVFSLSESIFNKKNKGKK